jgi:HSP20 family protein
MTPFGREPMGDLWSDRLWPEWPRWEGEEYRPSFDLFEKDGKYHLKAELPGIKKDDISISIDGDRVTITGKNESAREEEGSNYYLKEARSGSFSRSFQLPGEVDEGKVDANLKDGVLNVEMPLKETPKSRKVEIK